VDVAGGLNEKLDQLVGLLLVAAVGLGLLFARVLAVFLGLLAGADGLSLYVVVVAVAAAADATVERTGLPASLCGCAGVGLDFGLVFSLRVGIQDVQDVLLVVVLDVLAGSAATSPLGLPLALETLASLTRIAHVSSTASLHPDRALQERGKREPCG